MDRRAKIVATLGPASSGEDVLAQLLAAGVDAVRLNMSHGTQDSHRTVIRNLRKVSQASNRFVPAIIDLMGPRFRLAKIPDGPRQLETGEQVRFGAPGPGIDLPVESSDFLSRLKPGERVLIDNGMVEIEVQTVLRSSGTQGDAVNGRVLHGGLVSTRKGINLPDTDMPFTISEKDRSDIAFAVREGADYLAVSFVGGPEDLDAVRAVLKEVDGVLPLIAKLERAAPLSRLAETIAAADAVMVARGDLGVEMPVYDVPILQKKIIAAGRRVGKPVIVATQMLESMMSQPRPTRAEASDCANAVFDGTDALMLSGETAAGDYPVQTVSTMADIICEAESYRPPSLDSLPWHASGASHWPASGTAPGQTGRPLPLLPGVPEQAHLNLERDRYLEIPDAVSAAAVYAAHGLEVRRIVAFSQGGFTARMVARYRPRTPITVFTRDPRVARRVQLVWGARPVLMDVQVRHHDEVVSLVDRLLIEADLAQPGDVILILMGVPIAERPLTNLMRVHRVRGSRSPGDEA